MCFSFSQLCVCVSGDLIIHSANSYSCLKLHEVLLLRANSSFVHYPTCRPASSSGCPSSVQAALPPCIGCPDLVCWAVPSTAPAGCIHTWGDPRTVCTVGLGLCFHILFCFKPRLMDGGCPVGSWIPLLYPSASCACCMVACDSPLWLYFSATELFWVTWVDLTVTHSAIPLLYSMILAVCPAIPLLYSMILAVYLSCYYSP